jgi:hypothetical protein
LSQDGSVYIREVSCVPWKRLTSIYNYCSMILDFSVNWITVSLVFNNEVIYLTVVSDNAVNDKEKPYLKCYIGCIFCVEHLYICWIKHDNFRRSLRKDYNVFRLWISPLFFFNFFFLLSFLSLCIFLFLLVCRSFVPIHFWIEAKSNVLRPATENKRG